jgi:hypothetical protein
MCGHPPNKFFVLLRGKHYNGGLAASSVVTLYCLSASRANAFPKGDRKELGAEIRFAESLTDEERQSLFGWAENIFGVEDAKYRWRPKDYHFITEDDGRAVSHVGLLKTTVKAGGLLPVVVDHLPPQVGGFGVVEFA